MVAVHIRCLKLCELRPHANGSSCNAGLQQHWVRIWQAK